jgi:hypothetical protein
LTETTLNLIWVGLGFAALGTALCWEFQRRARSSAPLRLRRLLCVLVGVIFLFPCISFSDDLLSLANGGDNDHLVRLFLDLQNFEIPAHCLLPTVELCSSAVVVAPCHQTAEPCPLAPSGRSPPQVAASS